MTDTAQPESLIDRYIHQRGLADGARLPDSRTLAAELRCEEGAVLQSLEAARKKGTVTSDDEGWVVVSTVLSDHHPFSFSRSAETRGRRLATDVLESRRRRPLDDIEHPFYAAEQAAQKALGLADGAEFLVIVRFRLLDGIPSALHRAYLDPSRFPSDFLDRHNFETESLIDIYRSRYELVSRDTVLTARMANVYESSLLANRYRSEPHGRVVLDAEQKLYAKDSETGRPFVLEFLKASYLENWKYEIKNRPALSE